MEVSIAQGIQNVGETFFSSRDSRIERSNTIFEPLSIPIFQRDFSWKEEQIQELLMDLDDQIRSTNPPVVYFAGTILLEKNIDRSANSQFENDSSSSAFRVIDGQQRLTTFYLLSLLGLLCAKHRFLNIPTTSNLTAYGQALQRRQNKYVEFEKRTISYLKPESQLDPFSEKDSEAFYKLSDSEQRTLVNKRIGQYGFQEEYWACAKPKLTIEDKDINLMLEGFIKLVCNLAKGESALNLSNLDSSKLSYLGGLISIYQHLCNTIPDINYGDDLSDDNLGRIIEKIESYLDMCGFCVIISANQDDSFTLFEILNNRGAELTAIDLLKNDILRSLRGNAPTDFEVNWKTFKKNIKDAYGNTSKSDSLFTKDVIRSEASPINERFVSYLMTRGQKVRTNNINRHTFFLRETPLNFLSRLYNIAELKADLSTMTGQSAPLSGNTPFSSCRQNAKIMEYIRFDWGGQALLATTILAQKYLDQLSIKQMWNLGNTSIRNNITPQDICQHFLRLYGELLFRVGVVGILTRATNKNIPGFSMKLPDVGQHLTRWVIDYTEANENLSNLLPHFKIKLTEYNAFLSRPETENAFKTEIKNLTFRNQNHKKIMTILLYRIFNKETIYNFLEPTLDHLEPENPQSLTMPGVMQHLDRDNVISKIGNFMLIEKSDNSSFGNRTYSERMKLYGEKQHPIYRHSLMQEIYFHSSTNRDLIDKLKHDETNNLYIVTEEFINERSEQYAKRSAQIFCNVNDLIAAC